MKVQCIGCGVDIDMSLTDILQDEIELRKLLALEPANWQGIICDFCVRKYTGGGVGLQ